MKYPRIELICTGTELLADRVNTHTAGFGQCLNRIGLKLSLDHTVGDDEVLMAEVFRTAFQRADVIVTAGGLGPTFDDVTRDVWSRVLKRPLKIQHALVTEIREKFKARGLSMPPHNRRQGLVLRGANVIANPNGTAPGQILKIGRKLICLLPGPAREFLPMLDAFLLPLLQSSFPLTHVRQKKFHIVGVSESKIDALVRPLVSKFQRLNGCVITHGILASQSIITAKFRVEGPTAALVEKTEARVSHLMRNALAAYTFGEDNETLEGVIGRRLLEKKQTVAVAESCTGGLLSKMITDQPGASQYFIEGITTYSNESKMARLGVSGKTLVRCGAVSQELAREMAAGLKKRARVSYALSVTGIAGPLGGSVSKPVGLVYIGCAGPKRNVVQSFHFTGDRAWIRHRAALMALELLRKELKIASGHRKRRGSQ